MKEDKADDAAFRHSRDRHIGAVVETEFHQYSPKFFTRDRAAVSLEGMYRGASAFLICNGPSFAALDHNMLRKPGVMTFGVNNGPKSFRPNFWTCVDDPVRFIKSIWLDPKIQKFIPQSHFEKQIFDNETWQSTKIKVGDCPNVLGYCRNEKFHEGRFLTENSMNWGCSQEYGGCRSVMLPALRILHLLGFRKIYLLGCDMKMSQTYTYHFDEKRDQGAVNCNMNTYDRLKSEYLPKLKPYFESDGCFIYNCNPDSELKVFPFVSFEDAIRESTHILGDIENERVWGMYSKPEEKSQWKNEAPIEQKTHLRTLEAIKQHQELPPETFVQPIPKPKPQKKPPMELPQEQMIVHRPPPNCPRVDGNGNHLPTAQSRPAPVPMRPNPIPPSDKSGRVLQPQIIHGPTVHTINLNTDQISTCQPPSPRPPRIVMPAQPQPITQK